MVKFILISNSGERKVFISLADARETMKDEFTSFIRKQPVPLPNPVIPITPHGDISAPRYSITYGPDQASVWVSGQGKWWRICVENAA